MLYLMFDETRDYIYVVPREKIIGVNSIDSKCFKVEFENRERFRVSELKKAPFSEKDEFPRDSDNIILMNMLHQPFQNLLPVFDEAINSFMYGISNNTVLEQIKKVLEMLVHKHIDRLFEKDWEVICEYYRYYDDALDKYITDTTTLVAYIRCYSKHAYRTLVSHNLSKYARLYNYPDVL